MKKLLSIENNVTKDPIEFRRFMIFLAFILTLYTTIATFVLTNAS